MVETAPWFIIKRPWIWDYRWLHSSIPFCEKKRNLFNPPLWCSFWGCPGTAGWLASITGLKKTQNIRNQEEPWPWLAGKKASWPANKRCWVWSGRGRRHLAADHSGQWGHCWPAGVHGELSWKMGGAGSSALTLDFELQLQCTSTFLPPTSTQTALTDGSQLSTFAPCLLPYLLREFPCQLADPIWGSLLVNLKPGI